jgi:hypothetical protein
LAAVQELGCSKVFEVTVVGNDLDRGAYTFELRSLLLKAADDRQEFLIIDLVVILYRRVLLGEERNRSQYTIVSILRQDAGGDIIGGISFQDNLLLLVEWG